ncbi:MAG TPA: hypothetical protein VHZ95_06040, partial [Polyangiales bacterium]|nr:hypothetical protein [Polyangiales bacterium]
IGLIASNREVFYELFDSWAREIAPRHLDVSSEAWQEFRERMYGGEFVFCVGRDAVRAARSPLLVLMGNDVYHPSEISREIVALAADAELIERWKDRDAVAEAVTRVRDFLLAHTPA